MIGRITAWTFGIGFVAFLIGFVGPIIVVPDANQGPLLGIFITGPLGLVVGFIVGVLMELRPRPGGREPLMAEPVMVEPVPEPMSVEARSAWSPAALLAHPIARAGAALVAVPLALSGFVALKTEGGRGPAAAIVLGVALLWWAFTGRIPAWFRR